MSKKVLLTAVFAATVIGSTIPAKAQQVAATPAPAARPRFDFPQHYRKRCAAIKEQIDALPAGTTATVVLLGDSITEANRVKTLGGLPVVNEGIVADQIAVPDGKEGGLLNRIALVGEARPAYVFVMIGINDLGESKPLDRLENQYRKMVAEVRKVAPKAKLCLESVLPTSGRFARHNENVLKVNEKIAAIARENGAAYIDLHSMVKDEKGELRESITREGLHLKPEAYEAVNRELEKQMK